MGEAQKLTLEEAAAFATRVIRRVDGRVPVVVGVSAGGLAPLTELTRRVMDEGAAAVLVAPPAGLRTDDQIFEYVRGLVGALGPDVPVIYQDYPPTTNVYLSSTLFLRMVDAFASMVMLKLEDCPGLDKLTRIRADSGRDGLRRVSVLIGNGGLYFPQFLQRGADGAMTGFAFPDILVQVYARHVAGDADGAQDLFDAYLPLVVYEQQPGYGLAVRKEILRRRGAIRSAATRAPGPRLQPADAAEIDALMARLERRRGGI
jgi:4-hydroxy-tetrahydrodipicolinate synthase